MRWLPILAVFAGAVVLPGQQPPRVPPPPPDQPGQAVARLSLLGGDASVRRGDSGDWVAAAVNAPLMAGDELSIPPGGSAELQLDRANYVRVGGDSELRIAQLDNGRYQIQVSKGLLTWRVLRDSSSPNSQSPSIQSEISTPEAAVHPQRLSSVRVEVSSDGSTRVVVRRGDVEVQTPRGSERVHEGNMMLVRGAPDNPADEVVYAPARDEWDNWNDQRDAYLERAQSDRYVNPDIGGAEDLDAYGRWGYDPAYGNVWTPNVPPAWAPYQNGQWTWEDFYGWTWVSYDPWGWAPFHYGAWYYRTGFGWTWFPGPRYGRSWWRPAMVGFFGFGGAGVAFGNVGWVPLAPFEPFHPWYGPGVMGPSVFAGAYGPAARLGVVNFGVVNNVDIVNVYRNARVANGVMAVSAADFERGVFRYPVPVERTQLMRAAMVRGALPVTPTASNLRFGPRPVSVAAIQQGGIAGRRSFFTRMPAGGAGRMPFAQQQAAVRSAFGGARFGRNPPPPARGFGGAGASSGWSRFGEPSQAGGAGAARAFQGAGNTGAGWDRFGAPQGPPPAQGAFGRPVYNSFSSPGASRALQVAPPMVRQRPSPGAGAYRGPQQGSRGGNGNRRSGDGGGNPR